MNYRALLLAPALVAFASPASAESARDILIGAAFTVTDKPTALASIDRAIKAADAAIARDPADQDARLQRALAISYRGKLRRNRSDVTASRKQFEAVVAAEPRNAEAQLAIGCWHLGGVIELGGLVAGTMLGAKKAAGMKALDRAVALGGNRAFYPAIAAMHRIQIDPDDIAATTRLAEAAVNGTANTLADRVMQKYAAALLVPLRKGHGAAAAKTAKLLLPFGRVK